MTTTPSPSGSSGQSSNGLGCLILFSLPFAAVGVGLAGWMAYSVWEAHRVQAWVETPATIVQTNLERHRGSKGSVSFKATARYTYNFNGVQFQGNRVELMESSDNIGTFQQDAFNELKRHLDTKQPFRCYVNPSDPAQSILYRNLRWEMLLMLTLFGGVFGSVGFAMLSDSIVGWRNASAANLPAAAAEPWRARADWASGHIQQQTSGGALPILAAVGLFFAAASLPLLLVLPGMLAEEKSVWRWLLLIVPVIDCALLGSVMYCMLRGRKFGHSIFQLAGNTGIVGGPLAGVVRIPHEVQPADGFVERLVCQETNRSSGSSKHDVTPVVLWRDERVVTQTLRGIEGETAVPVLFAIPFSSRSSTIGSDMPRIEWRLEVMARLPGIDYKAVFNVPVFQTAESKEDFQLDPNLAGQVADTRDTAALLHSAGLRQETSPDGGVRLVFPAARNWGTALLLTFFSSVMWGMAWALRSGGAPLVFPIACGLMALLFSCFTLDLWLYRSAIEASPSGLQFRCGWLGLGSSGSYTADEIAGFDTPTYMTSNTKVWQKLDVKLADQKSRTIAKGLPGIAVARGVVEMLNTALGRA